MTPTKAPFSMPWRDNWPALCSRHAAMTSKVLHPIDHFFRRDPPKEPRQTPNLLADAASLVGQHDNAVMVRTLLKILAMQPGKVAYVKRVDGAALPGSKRKLLWIGRTALSGFGGGQQIDPASAKTLHDGMLFGIFIDIKTHIAHGCWPAACCRLNSSY